MITKLTFYFFQFNFRGRLYACRSLYHFWGFSTFLPIKNSLLKVLLNFFSCPWKDHELRKIIPDFTQRNILTRGYTHRDRSIANRNKNKKIENKIILSKVCPQV